MSFKKFCEFRENWRLPGSSGNPSLQAAYNKVADTIKASGRNPEPFSSPESPDRGQSVDLPVKGGDDFFHIMMKADDMLRRGSKGVNFTFQGQKYFIDENRMNHAMSQLQRIFQLV